MEQEEWRMELLLATVLRLTTKGILGLASVDVGEGSGIGWFLLQSLQGP
jgi:hypothetical protein